MVLWLNITLQYRKSVHGNDRPIRITSDGMRNPTLILNENTHLSQACQPWQPAMSSDYSIGHASTSAHDPLATLRTQLVCAEASSV